MMYQEFLSLTNSKVSYETYTNKIELQYMNSNLDKYEFCKQYVESTKRTKKQTDSNTFDKDKFIKAVKFETALKALSKMVQEKDGEVFYMSDVIDNRTRLLHKWKNEKEQNKERMFPLHEYQLRELVAEESGNIKEKDYYRTFANETEYYDYWVTPDGSYFRLQIELYEDGRAYIDCGYRNI